MNNGDYEIVYKEGDEVCFETRFPDFKYQPNYGGGGLFGTSFSGGLDKAEKIKGEIILIHDDRYHVLVGKAVYICRHSVLKPVSKPGGVLFFEVKEKEHKRVDITHEAPKARHWYKKHTVPNWATLILISIWFGLFFLWPSK